MKALILSGGGARGSYEAGVAISLLDREDFEIVCGASIGAINGALIAQGDVAELERMWASIASLGVIQLAAEVQELAKIVSDLQALTTQPLPQRARALIELYKHHSAIASARELRHLLGALSTKPVIEALALRLKFAWLKRTLIVSATNLTRGRLEAFYHFAGMRPEERAAAFRQRNQDVHELTSDNYLAAVCASAAVPGAFQPVTIETSNGVIDQYVDGGVINNLVSQAIAAGASDLTVVSMDQGDLRPPNERLSSIADIALAVQDIRQQHMLEADLKMCREVNKAVLAGNAPGKRFVSIRTIFPRTPLGLSALQFDNQALIDAAFAQGRRDGEKVAAEAS